MPTLADAILQEDISSIQQLLHYGEPVNQIDEYGFTPLIEAAIVNNIEISSFLLKQGANPNQQDVTGGTALQWAAENNNIPLCQLLLSYRANPNAYNFSGQPVLVMPTQRRQSALRKVLVKAGADQLFAQDYINTKLLGHIFELIGKANIVSPSKQLVEVDFEGFFLEITLGLIADSLLQFQNHFAARQLRDYAGLSQFIVQILERSAELVRYQHYQIDINKHRDRISHLLQQQPLVIPVGYEGHAITFICYDNIWIKCDRREDSRLYDNIMFYRVGNTAALTENFFRKLFYEKQNSEFINQTLDRHLQLTPITELKVEAQISGNCSWANVEATIPALFFLMLMQWNQESSVIAHSKTLSLNFFHRWREWNKERALQFCIQSFKEGDAIHKACKAEILAAILFQRCDARDKADQTRIETILSLLIGSPYEYLLRNYLRIYFYESNTEEGKRFAAMLDAHGFKRK